MVVNPDTSRSSVAVAEQRRGRIDEALYEVIAGTDRLAARMSSIIASHSPPSPTTLAARRWNDANEDADARTTSAKRSALDAEDPHIVTLEGRLGREETWMLALAVDAGCAVPEVERIGLAVARAEHDHPLTP